MVIVLPFYCPILTYFLAHRWGGRSAQDEIDRLFVPKVLTGWKRYTMNGEQAVMDLNQDEDGSIPENLIVKGNYLLSLHTLHRQFRGKVKLIYIDPPYNTGNDSFGFCDRFHLSGWLSFMKNLPIPRAGGNGSAWLLEKMRRESSFVHA